VWLSAVSVLHAAAPIIVLGIHWWFGVDETVYLSQINAHVQPGLFSAPRARGSALIAAPVTALTSSTAAVRLWLAMLSGVGLFAGFWPWLRVRRGYTAPLAAAVFSSIWTAVYYGFTVMPNEWVAYGALAAAGCVICSLHDPRRRYLVGAALAIAVVALFRPSDAVYLLVGAALATVVLAASWRSRMRAVAALVAGVIAGVAEWIVEAELRYGGLMRRVHLAQAENGGGGLHFAGAAQVRALAGPTLCRNGCQADAPVVYQLWWVAFGVLALIGIIHAHRVRHSRSEIAAAVIALVLAAQYVFTVTYAAPRFMLPSYALLSIPCAAGLIACVRAPRSKPFQATVISLLASGMLAHTALQMQVISTRLKPGQSRAYHGYLADARRLVRSGVRHPCLVLGGPAVDQIAYATGCTNIPANLAQARAAAANGTDVVWLLAGIPPRWRGVSWHAVTFRHPIGATSHAYVGLVERAMTTMTSVVVVPASVGEVSRWPHSAEASMFSAAWSAAGLLSVGALSVPLSATELRELR
jgi:hypothetical protein